jgi:hypothetical protein
MVGRDNAGEQGAGRQAWSVDDDPLAGSADLIEFLNIGGDLASRIADDSHVGVSHARH